MDIIVEDDCSESVILQELMGNGDTSMMEMNMSMANDKRPLRDERTSMMINRGDFKAQLGKPNNVAAPAPT